MYISNSQIIETGYTQGYEFSLSYSQEVYKGYYHKDNQGRYWTEKEHTSSSILLIKLTPPSKDITLNTVAKDNKITFPFSKLYNKDLTTPLLKSDFILPTDLDYKNGYFVRYIAQLKNSLQDYIIELNYDSYNKFINNKNLSIQYTTSVLLWQLTGPVNDIYNNNIRIKSGVKDTNLRSIQEAEKIIKGLSKFLSDPLQYSKT